MNATGSSPQLPIFAAPSGKASRLPIPPRLESWNNKGHTDQVILGAFLDSLNPVVRRALDTDPTPQVLELCVGLPDGKDLLKDRDLDNYLFPIVRRFGPTRFVAAIGRKVRGADSTLRVGPARPADPNILAGWLHASISTDEDDEKSFWKDELAAALPAETGELPPGPVELQVSFRGSRRKLRLGNWNDYWKPTVDALGRILGSDNPARPYDPLDDRITSIGFHRPIDGEVGVIQRVIQIDLWWRSAPRRVDAPI